MNIKAVSYPEKKTLRSRLLIVHAPTSSICVLCIPLLTTSMHPVMLDNVQEIVRSTWNCQNCTGILMCCLGTSNIYIIRNSTFFPLASISSHNIGYGQPNSVEIIQVHHSSSFVLKKTKDDTTVSLDNIPFSLKKWELCVVHLILRFFHISMTADSS